MRIYQSPDKSTILALDLVNRKVSTRSSYVDSFFNSLAKGAYTFFPLSDFGIKIANEKMVVFPERTEVGLVTPYHHEEEYFIFLGEASTDNELKALLKYKDIEKSNCEPTRKVSLLTRLSCKFGKHDVIPTCDVYICKNCRKVM